MEQQSNPAQMLADLLADFDLHRQEQAENAAAVTIWSSILGEHPTVIGGSLIAVANLASEVRAQMLARHPDMANDTDEVCALIENNLVTQATKEVRHYIAALDLTATTRALRYAGSMLRATDDLAFTISDPEDLSSHLRSLMDRVAGSTDLDPKTQKAVLRFLTDALEALREVPSTSGRFRLIAEAFVGLIARDHVFAEKVMASGVAAPVAGVAIALASLLGGSLVLGPDAPTPDTQVMVCIQSNAEPQKALPPGPKAEQPALAPEASAAASED